MTFQPEWFLGDIQETRHRDSQEYCIRRTYMNMCLKIYQNTNKLEVTNTLYN